MLKVMAVSDPPVNSAYPGRVRVEAATMGEAMEERYSMCQDQPAQIDCRVEACIFYFGGHCAKALPAITLNPDKSYVCWSEKTLEELDIERQSRKAEEATMKVLSVFDYEALQVTTNEPEWPDYRRYHAGAWEQCLSGDWFKIEGEEGEEVEAAYQEFLREDLANLAYNVERDALRPLFYRRSGLWAWEAKQGDGGWEKVGDLDTLARLERTYMRSGAEEAVAFRDVATRMKEQLQGLTADFQYPRMCRRCSPGVWEVRRLRQHGWERVKDPALIARLEEAYMNSGPEEATESTLKDPGQRYTDDFEWKASPANEFAQVHEALAYLVGIGEVFHPWWAWIALESEYQTIFQCDHRGLKVRQWRGKGFSREGLLTTGGKWGVILVISEEELMRLWHKSPERKLEFAKQITRETIEHAYCVGEGDPYPEYTLLSFFRDAEVAANEKPA